MNKFKELFPGPKKPIIGMLHLKGDTTEQTVDRALKELDIYEKFDLSGAIVENYHGSESDVGHTVAEISRRKGNRKIKIGVNILPNNYKKAFWFAYEHGAEFIQLDYISGQYDRGAFIDELDYNQEHKKYSNIVVLGGVWPKYYNPVIGSNLEKDIEEGTKRSDAIVVTGAGTGKETPVDKIKKFRKILNGFPLVIGAGVNQNNVKEQLKLADGAIVGSCFKPYNRTSESVSEERVKEFMQNL